MVLAGFDGVERAYLRENLVPDFEWVHFDRPSPRNRLGAALQSARVRLVATAGSRIEGIDVTRVASVGVSR
jgi:hypothetical protein